MIEGEVCLKIGDLKLSSAFMDCFYNLYESNKDLKRSNTNLRSRLKTTHTDKDYEWLNTKYQETLVDCNNQIRFMREKLNNDLKGEITKTSPYQDLLRKYNGLSYEHNKLQAYSVKSEDFKKEINDLIQEKAELIVKADTELKRRIPKIEARIRKDINDENKLFQKDKNNTYKKRIKILEKQIAKLKKHVHTLMEEKLEDDISSCSSEEDD